MMPPVPADRPLGLITARPIEYVPSSGNVCVIVGDGVACVFAPNASLNCQLYWKMPAGAVEPVASNVIDVPAPAVALNVAVGSLSCRFSRCRQVWPALLHSVWYQ